MKSPLLHGPIIIQSRLYGSRVIRLLKVALATPKWKCMKSPLLHGPIIIQSRLYGLQSYPPPQGGTGYAKMEMHEVTPPPRLVGPALSRTGGNKKVNKQAK